MYRQFGLSYETLVTQITLERSLLGVADIMLDEMHLRSQYTVANIALVRFLVLIHVDHKLCVRHTDFAFVTSRTGSL